MMIQKLTLKQVYVYEYGVKAGEVVGAKRSGAGFENSLDYDFSDSTVYEANALCQPGRNFIVLGDDVEGSTAVLQ